MGGLARALRLSKNSLLAPVQMAKSRYLGSNTCRATGTRRQARRVGLGDTLCRWHHRTRSPECCWCKKGDPKDPECPPVEPKDEALGRSRGGFSTKIHVRCEGKGKPVTFVLTPGQQHECTVFEQLMEQGSIKHAGRRGRARRLPNRIVGDKGYSSNKIRRYLRCRGVRYTIPRRKDEVRQTNTGPFDKAIYRGRNRVERLINRLKHNRRIATRYEKRAENYRAFLTIAAILLWL